MKNLPTLDCTGCSACAEKCPKKCISMVANAEGFLYPKVDEELCIHCELCEKVCPLLDNNKKERNPLSVYVGYNTDQDIVSQSSSGGIFTLLAERILEEGGVVFGARFNEKWEVIHDFVEKREDLSLFRGSKYLQSRIGNAFHQAESFLKEGRKVLFSGTPCQIAGLKSFLRKPYENLLAIDFICHGVPSPGIWEKYLNDFFVARMCNKNSVLPHSISEKDTLVKSISFRDKCLGWKKFSFALTHSTTNGSGVENTVLLSEPLDENYYLKGFLSDLYLRPSCYHCQMKSWKSGSDITIADAWGVNNIYPELDDDRGCSLVVLLTPEGQHYFDALKSTGLVNVCGTDEEFIRRYNPAAFVSAKPHKNRRKFFRYIQKGVDFKTAIDKCLLPPTYWDKIVWSINKRVRKYFK